jgi:prophage antirepressor-like protein
MEYNGNNQLQTLFYNEKEVRMAWKDGEPLWMLKDVCDAMKIKNSSDVAKRLNKDDIDLIYVIDSAGRQQQATMINEAALYSVVLRSTNQRQESLNIGSPMRCFRRFANTEPILPKRKRRIL